jgi:predicted kinase
MKIQTKLHTILLLIGPSNCGKSTLAKTLLKSDYGNKITLLSSDENRRKLLGENLHKHNVSMMHVSEQAFNMLFSDLRNFTSYPVNREIVIVDTTGLNEEFREKVIEVAKENHYNIEAIIFDYKNQQDYYKFMSEKDNKIVISKHVKKLKREVLPRTSLKEFNKIHKIKSPDEIIEFEIVNNNDIMEHNLLYAVEYEIVGDIHNNLSALKELILKDQRFIIEDNLIKYQNERILKIWILNGDWIDKGTEGNDLIEFIYANLEWFYLIKGNHENFVYKYLKGKITDLPPQDVIDKYFTSIKDLQGNESIMNKFFELVEQSKDFYIHKNFIVTHAPCKRKYLGKLDPQSLRMMRSFTLPKKEDFISFNDYELDLENKLSFLKDEASSNQPVHIFGHVPFQNRLIYRNKIGIDTGAGDNHILTSIIINGFQIKPFIKQIVIEGNKELPTIFKRKESIQLIDPIILNNVKTFASKKINYISGTMSPADKDIDNNILESVGNGLNYYKEKGITDVVLQPKYMGSRCQIYLFEDINKCYAVSRNGYKVNHVDLTPIYEKMIPNFFTSNSYLNSDKNEAKKELFIFDGELMPWYTLGKGLIVKQYDVIKEALHMETQFLQDNKFYPKMDSIANSIEFATFKMDCLQTKLSKKELIEKYTHFKYETYINLINMEKQLETSNERDTYLSIFNKQIELYGQNTEMEYKPFSLLKIVYEDGSEDINPYITAYSDFMRVSNDTCKLIYFDEEKYYERSLNFFNKMVTEKFMEGIVIKPNRMIDGIAPYIKVRNPNYLTLIYGHDYLHPSKYDKLIKQKNINRKLRTSIKEYNLANKLLAIPYKDICIDNNDYLNLIIDLTEEIQKEKELDPRL